MILNGSKLRGLQYDSHTSELTIREDLEYKIENDYFYLKNGVTGYEGLTISELQKDLKDEHKIFSVWIACMGTKNRYHRLEIPICDIRRILKI